MYLFYVFGIGLGTTFSTFFWSLILGGFLGALLAIPLTASVKVLFIRYIWDPTIFDQESAEAAAGDPL